MTFAPAKSAPVQAFPQMPKHCTVTDCTCNCDLIFVEAADSRGQFHSGPAAEFMILRDKKKEMRPGYEFLSWIGRCHDHFIREMWAVGRYRWNENLGATPHICHEDMKRKGPNLAVSKIIEDASQMLGLPHG